MASNKKPATSQYLKEIEQDLGFLEEKFGKAKSGLYKVVATAKLGQSDFELYRKECLELNDQISKLTKERNRVSRELKDVL